MNFPYLGGEDNNFRIPLCGIEKRFVTKGQTFDDILEVFTWSLSMLATKQRPSCRHDGTMWIATDCWRSRINGSLPLEQCEVVGKCLSIYSGSHSTTKRLVSVSNVELRLQMLGALAPMPTGEDPRADSQFVI
jgi:hypothetical protein